MAHAWHENVPCLILFFERISSLTCHQSPPPAPAAEAKTMATRARHLIPRQTLGAVPGTTHPRRARWARHRRAPRAAGSDDTDVNNLKIVEPAFVGLRRDLKQRLPFYVSDYVEGLNLKCVASTLFMFFACLAPAVAFGSLLNVKTQGAMGALEMLVSTSICGMVYALFSGQPVTIIGSTGPVLAFTAIMYSTCQQFALPFLSTYAWVGLWTSGILLLCALTSTSNLVIRYLTRFTDEIFAGLISVIFVVEALKNIVGLVFTGSVGGGAALLSVMSAVATCAFAMKLSGLRTSRWFTKRVRDTVADFGPTVSIISCTAVCGWLAARYGISLEYLSLPTQIVPTTPRPWVVNLMETPVWARWGASLPAVMVSILMFFDQNITTRLVNSKDNKMKKGYGYHMDLLVVALNTLVFSMLGMPWLVAATVRSGLSIILLAVLLDSDLALLLSLSFTRSVNHLRSLTTFGTVGEKTEVVGVTETRITNFAIHACIGLSILYARDLLTKIPQVSQKSNLQQH